MLFQIKYVFVFVLKLNDSINFLFCFNLLKIGYYNVDVLCMMGSIHPIISSRMYFTMYLFFKYTCPRKEKSKIYSARFYDNYALIVYIASSKTIEK